MGPYQETGTSELPQAENTNLNVCVKPNKASVLGLSGYSIWRKNCDPLVGSSDVNKWRSMIRKG